MELELMNLEVMNWVANFMDETGCRCWDEAIRMFDAIYNPDYDPEEYEYCG